MSQKSAKPRIIRCARRDDCDRALDTFTALWVEARSLRGDFPGDWMDDLESDLPLMLIGGQAVLLHGEPRLTQDMDTALGVGPSRLAEVLGACESLDYACRARALRRSGARTFVLPAEDIETVIRVDLIFSTTPYEAQAIGRAVHVVVGGQRLPFASTKDLMIHKLFAGRPRGLEDAAGVAERLGDALTTSPDSSV